jgi:glucosylceramidase
MTLRAFVLTLSALSIALLANPVQSMAQSVNVWLTTDNQKTKLKQQPSLTFKSGIDQTLNTIFVDETQTYQTIEGFGASFTDSAAYLLNEKVPEAKLGALMTSLFDHTNGIGISFVRNPMGASDIARFDYSYDDQPGGQTDPNLTDFSIAHDLVDIVPLVKMAKQINPQLEILATPWSPPGWMKTSDSMIGGSALISDYPALANYFVKYIQAYAAQGISIDYITPQNEPLNLPTDYPGMSMDAPTQLTFVRDFLLPALSGAGVSTRVLLYDHNWDQPGYPETILSDPTVAASPQVAGTAWHGYAGTPGAMFTVQNQYPGKGNYETEHSGGTWISDQVQSDFEEIIQVMRNWGKSYVKWSLALDQNRGPHTGGCGTCSPLVTVNEKSGKATYYIDYYTLGHFSKFVLPGATRVYSTNASGFVSAAFKNPDGSSVVVVYNDTPSKQSVQVAWGGQSFTYSFKGLSGATFVWSGSQSAGYTINATQQIQASSFNSVLGLQTETTSDKDGGYDVGYSSGGDWALYKNIDFGSGVTSVSMRLASAGSGGTLEFHLGAVDGPLIGSVTAPITGGWQTWTTVSSPISGATGVNDVYLVFQGTTSICNVNWFQFQ